MFILYFVMDKVSDKIYLAALKFLVPLSLNETYVLVVSEAMKFVGAEYGSILLKQGRQLRRMYASHPAFYQIKIGKNDPMYDIFKLRRSAIFNRKQIFKIHPEITKTPVNSDLIVPLFYKNKSIGILTLMSSKKRAFTKKDSDAVTLFSPLGSLAIRKAELYDETKKALEARDLFISMAAHELRTPLTTINGYIQLLKDKFRDGQKRESNWVGELSREGQRLIKLVNEFLQIERIKSGKLQYLWQECELSEVIKRAKSNLLLNNPNYKIVFQNKLKNHSDRLIGDIDKLTQAVGNVLGNAVKYSKPENSIAVRLEFKAPNLVLKIHDKGKGIPKKDLPNVFKRYYRGSSAAQREGIGLGLYLVENIIKEHRGKVRIYSRENRGTTVEIRLPSRA